MHLQEDVPAYLATSPLPSCEFIMEAGVKELHRQVAEEEAQASVEPAAFHPHPDHYNLHAKRGSQSSNSSSMAGSPRDPTGGGVYPTAPTAAIEIGANGKPRRKVLKKKKQHQKQSQQSQQQQSASHHPHHHHNHHSKSGSARSGMRSVSMPEGVTEEAVMFEMEESTSDESINSYDDLSNDALAMPSALRRYGGLHSTSSPNVPILDLDKAGDEFQGLQLQGTTSHRRMSSFGNPSFLSTPFSEPETSPICRYIFFF